MNSVLKAIAIILLSAQVAWGTASDYNATTSKLAVTHFAGLASNTTTWCGWFYRDTAGENSIGRYFDKEASTGLSGFVFQVNGGSYNFFYRWDSNARWAWTITATGAWRHHCIAYDNSSTANDPTLWIDGVVYTTGFSEIVAPTGTAVPGTNVFNIGNDPTSAATWDGRIADAAYYTRILGTNEVKQIMHKGPNSVKNGLVCYWPMGAFVGVHAGGSGGASCSGTFTANVIVNTGPPVSVPQGGFGW